MATLAPGGRISIDVVNEEIDRLHTLWKAPGNSTTEDTLAELLDPRRLENLDLFDRAQLAFVANVCKRSRSLSEAGRALFSASRNHKAIANDADRLRKYLSRFGVEFSQIHGRS
jgi:transcriptional regulatory protein RtcR